MSPKKNVWIHWQNVNYTSFTCNQWKKWFGDQLVQWGIDRKLQAKWQSYSNPVARVFAPSTPTEISVLVTFSTLYNTYLHSCRQGMVWKTHILIFFRLGPFFSYFYFLTSFHVVNNLLWYISPFLFQFLFFSTHLIYVQVLCSFLHSAFVCYLFFSYLLF